MRRCACKQSSTKYGICAGRQRQPHVVGSSAKAPCLQPAGFRKQLADLQVTRTHAQTPSSRGPSRSTVLQGQCQCLFGMLRQFSHGEAPHRTPAACRRTGCCKNRHAVTAACLSALQPRSRARGSARPGSRRRVARTPGACQRAGRVPGAHARPPAAPRPCPPATAPALRRPPGH